MYHYFCGKDLEPSRRLHADKSVRFMCALVQRMFYVMFRRLKIQFLLKPTIAFMKLCVENRIHFMCRSNLILLSAFVYKNVLKAVNLR